MITAPVIDRLSSLADLTRSRMLLALDGHELTVGELCTVLQLPQSTVSRHLKVLGDDGWLASRAEGTSRFYRRSPQLDDAAAGLWEIVRQDIEQHALAREDATRIDAVLRSRQTTSRAFFSSAAARWDALRSELYGEHIDTTVMLGLLESTWTVGDLGCGTGALAAGLAPHVSQVVAVDASESMLSAARRRLAPHAHVDVRAGELESLPIDADTLDAGFLTLVLHYVAEPLSALREAHRVLRTGGKLVVVDMLPHGREELKRDMGHLWQGFSAKDLLTWLAAAGFESVRAVPLAVEARVKGPPLVLATGVKRRSHEMTG